MARTLDRRSGWLLVVRISRSRRALAMPQRCVDALSALWDARRCAHTHRAVCDCLVFTGRVGTPLDAHNVRRDFRKVAEAAGLRAGEWTPRELRHSLVFAAVR